MAEIKSTTLTVRVHPEVKEGLRSASRTIGAFPSACPVWTTRTTFGFRISTVP